MHDPQTTVLQPACAALTLTFNPGLIEPWRWRILIQTDFFHVNIVGQVALLVSLLILFGFHIRQMGWLEHIVEIVELRLDL